MLNISDYFIHLVDEDMTVSDIRCIKVMDRSTSGIATLGTYAY